MENSKVKVAVVTGGHGYNVIEFHHFFRSIPDADIYIQHIDDFCVSPENVRDSYDVVLFYIMMTEGPTDEGLPWYSGKPKTAMERLGQTSQGLFIMHHALLAYTKWSVWSEIVGISNRSLGSFHIGEKLNVNVANPDHPITKGLSNWEMIDETYVMKDADEGNNILLTTDHPKSMKTLAWTRQYKNSKVFCLECGHDDRTWKEPNFHTVVARGIQWAAGKL